MRNIMRFMALAALSVSLFSAEAKAQQVNLTFGTDNNINLIENLADQRVDFFINDIAGKNYDVFELWIQIGDGGTVIGGSDTGPRLTGVDLGPGTIFEGGVRGGGLEASQTDLLWADYIDSAVATDDGLGGTLIFDTTGFLAGTTIDIRFEGIDIGGDIFNTNFRNGIDNVDEIVAPSSNGVIRVISAVPEPASSVVILAVAGLIGVRRRR
ncbi:PEP-CTERM sorting domain-containing protein [Mariniblastus fucicola]|uniref:Ice-binding protein C-terminal domain-containing protein n=1 Tax=Mariniblastus fucicola TaxID=980251 RepID=A0A5B9PM44_9BACT|nr:PEP-CTERM sorting domain-containing protein [Mariniblastus fucicola]QEG23711.1 hypothetical protein MFFC18_36120 [Mariniblastus fucicola]